MRAASWLQPHMASPVASCSDSNHSGMTDTLCSMDRTSKCLNCCEAQLAAPYSAKLLHHRTACTVHTLVLSCSCMTGSPQSPAVTLSHQCVDWMQSCCPVDAKITCKLLGFRQQGVTGQLLPSRASLVCRDVVVVLKRTIVCVGSLFRTKGFAVVTFRLFSVSIRVLKRMDLTSTSPQVL